MGDNKHKRKKRKIKKEYVQWSDEQMELLEKLKESLPNEESITSKNYGKQDKRDK